MENQKQSFIVITRGPEQVWSTVIWNLAQERRNSLESLIALLKNSIQDWTVPLYSDVGSN